MLVVLDVVPNTQKYFKHVILFEFRGMSKLTGQNGVRKCYTQLTFVQTSYVPLAVIKWGVTFQTTLNKGTEGGSDKLGQSSLTPSLTITW